MIARRAALVLLAGSVACGAPSPIASSDASGPLGATSLDEAPFQEVLAFGPDDGRTALLEIPAFDGDSLALWARTSEGSCFRVASLDDGAGVPGPVIAPARDAALVSLTQLGDFVPSRGVSIAFQLIDCTTTGRARPSRELSLEVGWAGREQTPERGALALRFVVSRHSMLFGRPDLRRALAELVAGELEEAGVEISVDEARAVELEAGVPEEASAWSLEPGELASFRALAPLAPRATVDVVFAGCLVYDDPFSGPPREVDGFTPRVTGGGGAAADAVYMPGLRCDSFGSEPEEWRLDRYAHVLAHELGHFLGLDHAVEADGRTDALDDTQVENIMHWSPGLAIAQGWSPSQARRMRAHPWVGASSR